jgi:hypothetical protein
LGISRLSFPVSHPHTPKPNHPTKQTTKPGFLLIPQRQPQPLGLLVILLLGLSGFVPSAFINDINTPGWTIGSLFVLYAVRWAGRKAGKQAIADRLYI